MQRLSFFLLFFLISSALSAQDLDALLAESVDEEDAKPRPVAATFKSTRVINLHSIETRKGGDLDFRIAHRFGALNGGVEQFWGLDQATIRLSLEYALTDNILVGASRSSYQKTYEAFAKYKVLEQKSNGGSPLTATLFASAAANSLEAPFEAYDFKHRLGYVMQLHLARKFSEGFSFQLSPGVVHKNLVNTPDESNQVFNLGAGGRLKVTQRLALTAEYIYLFGENIPTVNNAGPVNVFSLGVDIETGGHVFQLHFSNANALFERGFISETTGTWADGDIYFGFNILRAFTLKK